MSEIKQLKQKELKKTRDEILEKQNFRCAICGKLLSKEDCVLDHQHKIRKSDPNGENGNGLIRGVLCREDNCLEGRLFNNMFRYKQLKTDAERIEWLQNLIEYYKQPKYPLIHPTEEVKEPQISKRNFNKLSKLYKSKYPQKKPLEYPKSGKLAKPLAKLFEEFDVNPYN